MVNGLLHENHIVVLLVSYTYLVGLESTTLPYIPIL